MTQFHLHLKVSACLSTPFKMTSLMTLPRPITRLVKVTTGWVIVDNPKQFISVQLKLCSCAFHSNYALADSNKNYFQTSWWHFASSCSAPIVWSLQLPITRGMYTLLWREVWLVSCRLIDFIWTMNRLKRMCRTPPWIHMTKKSLKSCTILVL